MKFRFTRQFAALLVGHLLIAAAISANELSEHRLTATIKNTASLNLLVPAQLDDWQQQPLQQNRAVITAGPYTQLVERVYSNPKGYQIMVSIAYGSKQIGDEIQAHRPEYCYRSQGFQIMNSRDRTLTVNQQKIPVRDLTAVRQNRVESISYLLTIGNETVLPGFSRKMAQIRQSITGNIPDGMVIRISSTNIPESEIASVHNAFFSFLLPYLNVGTTTTDKEVL